ncbi:MAG: hypothetical protein GY941_02655 [Planctomycetes bacterium]|nr:hypothetical protein [Planctomycetota bacterium]
MKSGYENRKPICDKYTYLNGNPVVKSKRLLTMFNFQKLRCLKKGKAMMAEYREKKRAIRVLVLSVLLCLVSLCAQADFPGEVEEGARAKRNIVDYTPVQGFLRSLRLRREPHFEYACNECHRIFGTVEGRKGRIAEHVDLKLNHGSNDNCMNCHHKTNRNAYVASDGKEIPSNRPEILCSKCHGIVYRGWKIGAHGRVSGSWNFDSGGIHILVCTECHNPHDPGFPRLAPMPGPAIPGGRKGDGVH